MSNQRAGYARRRTIVRVLRKFNDETSHENNAWYKTVAVGLDKILDSYFTEEEQRTIDLHTRIRLCALHNISDQWPEP